MTLQRPIARIHRPARSAMQSGKAGLDCWVVEFAPDQRPRIDPLTGWSGGLSTLRQVRLRFPSAEAAEAFCRAQGIAYVIEPDRSRRPIKPKSYADNFRYGRLENWTH
ncbi:MAG: ETC complex I subunit [Rhodovarius sp.]|nr:ETC complex I subunit [Rhodovarius sp.]MCX7933021.1 ETC complex I subunit [Rhodovarius sp.]MDW8314263.1 ETC complex I subunit [Rhodovarius sp.]